MYCAKQRGRNNLQCFEPGMDTDHARPRQARERSARRAAQQQFVLLYQPKVDTATDDFHSVEALIRWHHPERGVIMPEDFIPLAEDCGLISAIGEWVLREVCRQCQGLAARRPAAHARRGERLGHAVPPGQPARRHPPGASNEAASIRAASSWSSPKAP